MSVCLLDANVLIAMAWPSHAHHELTRSWFNEHCRAGWATCPFTEAAFVRISSNARVSPEPVSPKAAILMLATLTLREGYEFWADELSFLGNRPIVDQITGHKQVTDAYLLALAVAYGGRLVTLDRGLESLVSGDAALAGHLEVLAAD